MSDDPARSLSGLRILVLDQDRSRGDALSALLREAGAEAGTVPEGVEPAVVIAEAVPDGIVIDRASPALDPIKLRATLESDTFLRSIVIVPGVLGEAMRDGAMALKRLVTVRLAARLALAKNLESGNEAEGSVTDVGPSAIVRLAARAPYPARVEVTVGPRQITVSTADGLLLGVTEAAGGKVTQRGLDALAALLASDGGKFRISKETKGPIGNLVGEPDEHLRNAAAMSRRTTTRPPPAGAPITVPKVGGARLPEPTRPTAPGPAVPGPTPGGAVPRPASSPVAPPASPRAVVALSDNPRPLGRTLLGVPAQGSDAPPPPGRSASAPASPITIPRPPEPAPQTAAEPSDGLPVPREPLPVAARPGGPVRSKTLLGIAAPTLPGRATVGGPPAATATPALDPITSKVETPAEVLVRSKPAELDDDVATDRLEKRAPRAPLPGPSATELEESETLLADRSALSDSGSDMPTAIGPRPDVVAMMAEALEPSAAAAAGTEPRAASPSVVPVRNIVIDEAATVPRSRALPETEPAAPKVVPGFDAEAPTVPRAARQPESESAASIRSSLAHAPTVMAMPTPAKAPTSPAAGATSAAAASVMGDQERAGGAAVTAEMSAPQAPSVTAEMSAPPAASVTAEMAPIAPSAPSAEARAPAPADPLGSTWATSRPISGPQVGHDEWSDGGGAPDLTKPRPRPPEPAPSRFPVAAVVGVVILGAAVGIGAMWAMKVGPFAPAPPPPSSPTPEPPPDRPPEAPPPTEPSTPPLGAPTTPTDPTAPAASDDAGVEASDAGAAAPAPTPPTPAPANPPDPQPATETGDDTRGLRDAQDALGRGDVAGARQILARLSARERSSPHGEALQSQVSERAGDLDGAITHARRAASMRPGRSSYRTRLGDLLLRAGAAGAARSEYEAALRTNPRDQNARRALERMGVHPPSGGGTATPPSGGTDSPPPSGGTDSPPPSGGTDSPPPSGGTDSPPSGGTDSPPPPPPPSGGTDSPPPAPPPEPPPAPPAEPAPGGSGAAPTPP